MSASGLSQLCVRSVAPFKPKKINRRTAGTNKRTIHHEAAEGERRSPGGQKGTRKEKVAQIGEVGACSSSVQGFRITRRRIPWRSNDKYLNNTRNRNNQRGRGEGRGDQRQTEDTSKPGGKTARAAEPQPTNDRLAQN